MRRRDDAGIDASVDDIDATMSIIDATAHGNVCYGTGLGKVCFAQRTVPARTTLTAQTIDTDTSPLCSTTSSSNNPGGA